MRWVKMGLFPSPIQISARAIAWNENEVQDWIKERMAGNVINEEDVKPYGCIAAPKYPAKETTKSIFMELWNHGLAGNVDEPCGEVDIFNISGEKLNPIILEKIFGGNQDTYMNEWFGHLPTEKALLVEVVELRDDSGCWLEIKDFSFLPITDKETVNQSV